MITAAQLKGRIKNMCDGDSKKAEALIRLYFMERFLERVSLSEYKERFILKGGLLASSLIGVDLRTTMDIDTTVRAIPLNEKDITDTVNSICKIDVDDQVTFEVVSTETIMDEFDYPGVRVHMLGHLDKIRQTVKIDVSTDDVITPEAIEYEYRLLLEDRTINILTYNTETLLAEKVQTILQRGLANTRMRDYYDLFEISRKIQYSIDILAEAFVATCKKRETLYSPYDIDSVINDIKNDSGLMELWERYKDKNKYVGETSWNDVIESLVSLCNQLKD